MSIYGQGAKNMRIIHTSIPIVHFQKLMKYTNPEYKSINSAICNVIDLVENKIITVKIETNVNMQPDIQKFPIQCSLPNTIQECNSLSCALCERHDELKNMTCLDDACETRQGLMLEDVANRFMRTN
jgi:hypothetical protein